MILIKKIQNRAASGYEEGGVVVASRRRSVAILMLVLLLALLLWAAGCGALRPARPPAPAEPPPGQGGVHVVTTVHALADFTRTVGGGRVRVDQLTPAGGHLHEFEPTPRDLERILSADLFLYNGAAFEPWIDDVIESARGTRTVAVNASREIQLLGVDATGPAGGDGRGADPHVWLDPRRAAQQVAVIAEALIAIDPDGEAAYRANADAFRAQLEDLDRQWSTGLAACRLRDVVVEHGAFGYLAHRYGLNQVAVTGLAADQEPTPRRLAELAAFMAERGIHTVYREPGSTSGVVEALASETGASVLTLHPLETLGADEAARGETYLTIMRSNLEALQQGLDCGGA